MLDVAHNPHAARVLAATLGAMGFHPRTIAVFGMLADKDIARRHRGDEGARRPLVRRDAAGPARRERRRALRDALVARGRRERRRAHVRRRRVRRSPRRGSDAGEADRIVVFGSFLTVAAALAAHGRDAERRTPGMAERIADNADLIVDEMKRKARRRLVGAIVLALAAAIILPLLLEKEPRPLGDDVSVQIPPVDEGKFVNRLTGKSGDRQGAAESRRPSRCRKLAPPKPESPRRRDSDAATRRRPLRRTRHRRCAGARRTAHGAAAAEIRRRSRADACSRRRRKRTTATGEDRGSGAVAASAAARRMRRPPTRRRPSPAAPTRSPRAPAAGARPKGFVVQLAAFADDKGANALAEQAEEGRLRRHTPSRSRRAAARCGACASAAIASRPEADAARAKLKGEGYNGIVVAAK